MSLLLTSVVMSGCEATVDAVPEGALARVGDTVIEGERLEATHSQLDAYGQARFRGPEGRRALVEALIEQELLVQEARDAGLSGDPRVEWAVLEELAQLQRTAMLERRLPRASVAQDLGALRARWQREQERFTEPERRRMRVVRVETWDEGEELIARLQAGEQRLEDLGELVRTPLMKRDEAEFPAYHRALFDPALEVGELVPTPVLSGRLVLVGEVDEIQPAHVRPFEDPQVREQLVREERAARLEPVEDQLLAELAQRFVLAE